MRRSGVCRGQMIPSHVVKSLALVQSIWASTPARLPGTGLQLVRLADASRGTSLERISFGANVHGIACDRGGESRASFQTGYGRSDPGERRALDGSWIAPSPRTPRVDAKWPA